MMNMNLDRLEVGARVAQAVRPAPAPAPAPMPAPAVTPVPATQDGAAAGGGSGAGGRSGRPLDSSADRRGDPFCGFHGVWGNWQPDGFWFR